MNARYACTILLAATFAGSSLAQPGTLDLTFDGDGIRTDAPGDLHDVAYDVIALPDNTLLVCGVARHSGRNAIFIAHYLEDGALDVSFGTDAGYTFFNLGEEAYGYAMGRDSQGRIYVAGLAYPTFAQAITVLVRTDATGIPDTNFDGDGLLEIPIGSNDSQANGLVVLADDDVILGGSVVGADFVRDAMLVKVGQGGAVDANFGVNGFLTADGPSGESLLNDITLLDDGSIVGAGYTDVNFVQKTFMIKAGPNGQLDPAFDTDGIALPDIGTNSHSAWGLTTDGASILMTGMLFNGSENDIFVTKIRVEGVFDPVFGGGAPVIIDLDENETGFDIAINSGQIYVCGTTGQGGFGVPRDFFVSKMNGDGVINAAFGTGGSVVTSVGIDFDDANAIAIQPDGKLVAAGFTAAFTTGGDNSVALVRYWDDGSTVVQPVDGLVNGMVFPNPASGSTVTINGTSSTPLHIAIADASGRTVRMVRPTATTANTTVDIAGLADGRYTILLTTATGFERHALVIAR